MSQSDETKYGQGITSTQTYKVDVDELIKHKERQDWKQLRKDLKEFGIRNSTLMALMPSETSHKLVIVQTALSQCSYIPDQTK